MSGAAVLGACSSGITLFNNAGPAPYGHSGGGALPTTMPMPQQPFVGNQLAAGQVAAQQRPIYVYQPASGPYPGQGYAPARYAAQPQYAAVPRKRIKRRVKPKRKYTVAAKSVQARVPVKTAQAYNPGLQRVRAVNHQEGRVVIVRSGETLYSIARRHNVNIINLKAANNIQGSNVRLGQRLFIPGVGSHHRGQTFPAAPKSSVVPARSGRGVTVAQFQNQR